MLSPNKHRLQGLKLKLAPATRARERRIKTTQALVHREKMHVHFVGIIAYRQVDKYFT